MTGISAITTDGTEDFLTDAAVAEFQNSLRGQLIRPGDADYDVVRKIWNAMIDKRPALIARCRGVSDVINCVNFARDHHLLVSVRGGGHNVAGISICDGGLMIDLSLMKGVRVDPVHRTARAEPGVTWGELDQETQAFGLVTPGGIISTTGIAGLTLGGGVGWLVRKHGLSCDNLVSADLVTADGRLLTVSADANADLFWGIRGGGGNFGIVTSFEYRLHPHGNVLGGMLLYPRSSSRDLLRFYREFMPSAPEDLGVYAGLLTSPDGQPVTGLIVCYSGPLEHGSEVIRPLREFGQPIADLITEIPHRAMQTMLDGAFPAGNHNYWKSTFLGELSDDAIDAVIDCGSRVTSPLSVVVLEYYGGAASRVGETETAFAHRRAQYDLGILGQWTDPAQAEQHIKWVRDSFDAIQPYSNGNYLFNFLGLPDDQKIDQVRAAAGQNYARLVELKNQYDPTNFFRLNPNIEPTV